MSVVWEGSQGRDGYMNNALSGCYWSNLRFSEKRGAIAIQSRCDSTTWSALRTAWEKQCLSGEAIVRQQQAAAVLEVPSERGLAGRLDKTLARSTSEKAH
jgi:hypothetical protein